jgi:Flp pilus assembly protein TadG
LQSKSGSAVTVEQVNKDSPLTWSRQIQASRPFPILRFRALCGQEGEEGGALVEMAVTLPLIMLIMTGIFSFSIAIYQKLQLSEAVSNGGHYLAVDRGDTDPCKTVANAIYAAAPGLASGSMSLSFTINGGSSTGPTCTGSAGANNMVSGGTAEILASYPCTLSVYGMNFASNCSLQTQITEVVQ